jgi:uncharacterized protein (TIGR04255 family)
LGIFMTHAENRTLPQFTTPPVIETVMGVQFVTLPKWNAVHFGVFWQQIKDEYPNFEVKPPVPAVVENLDPSPQNISKPQLQLLEQPEMRCWFISNDKNTLIQVQSDCFLFNWKAGNGTYPHYFETIRPAFVSAWTKFSDFVRQERLGDLGLLQCQMSYVNHIDLGKGWNEFSELGKVFPSWAGTSSDHFLPEPEDVTVGVRYRLPNQKGRLLVQVQPAIRTSDGVKVLQLTLTVRGKPDSVAFDSAMRWLDFGHEWIVRGFADLTSEQMHKLWGKVP